jgi:predicted acylesterase/phospholipase RssA
MGHTPSLAAGAGGSDAPKRSLILAGGGMRVAWQAGVLCALEEAGLAYADADGTSGGTMTLGMLLSGRSPREMCERWRTLDVHGFSAPLRPLRTYLHTPRLPGLGGADGIVKKVYPHLGIDVDSIRSAEGIEGNFNLCNHVTKANESIVHRDVDIEALVGAVSLPIFMPPVRHNGALYNDSAWIKDANLLAAMKRGCEELWIIWCIGNTPEYRNGAFFQYVHMMEQSGNGVLFEEFGQIEDLNEQIRAGSSPYGQRRPIVAHVIKPRYAIPLDPDFYFGRVDAATLVAMGYRDASRYLDAMDPAGVAMTPAATRQRQPGISVWWREAHAGELGDGRLELDLSVEVPDAGHFGSPDEAAELAGRIRSPAFGDVLLRDGSVTLASGELVYDGVFASGGRRVHLRGHRSAAGGAPMSVELTDEGGAPLGSGRLRSLGGGPPPARRLSVTNAPSTWRRLATEAAFRCRVARQALR